LIKSRKIIGIAVLAAALLLPGVAGAAMWVGLSGGVNVVGNADFKGETPAVFATSFTAHNVKFDNPQALGGITFGYDFVKTGFAGSNCWPEWMKYFSFAVDFTYNTFQIRAQDVGVTGDTPGGMPDGKVGAPFSAFGRMNRVEGTMAALTFLFMAKYGFYCDSAAPFGRIVPYVGVGPGIVWSSVRSSQQPFPVIAPGTWHGDSTDIALVAEAGVRWVCLSNVSIDTSFRYRWFEPRYAIDSGLGEASANVKTNINSYTALLRVNYHF
jgi:opacity protein-like surface antigen